MPIESTCKRCNRPFVHQPAEWRVYCSVGCAVASLRTDQSLIDEARQLWNSGMSQRQIGKQLGISHNSVAGMKSRHGGFLPREPLFTNTIGAKPRHNPVVEDPEKAAQFRADWHAGVSIDNLRRKYGFGERMVRNTRLALNLSDRDMSPANRSAALSRVNGPRVTLPEFRSVGAAAVVREPRYVPEPVPASQRGRCQYITSEGRPWKFCDAPTDGVWISVTTPSPYCGTHRRICYPATQHQIHR